MNTIEVLTLLLVVFTALAYIDNHQKTKEASAPPKVKCFFYNNSLRASDFVSDNLSVLIIYWVLDFFKHLFEI